MFEIRQIGRGRDLGGEVEVLSGLAAGETIVVDGAFLLKSQAEKRRRRPRRPLRRAMIARTIRTSLRAPLITIAARRGRRRASARSGCRTCGATCSPTSPRPSSTSSRRTPAMGAEELETAIAIPLEVELAGLPDVRRIRSNSQLGVAQVTVEFEPDADYYRSRQFVAERVAQAAGAAARRAPSRRSSPA